ncbi:retrovirus-related pol polyprotein from transposon TNT 1-94, partial [Tanacetum coccineum]
MVMALPAQNINHSAFRSMLKREKLFGTNFNDWFRQLRIVLRVEKKLIILDQHISPAPVVGATNEELADWNAVYDVHYEVTCLMLGSMTPELQRQFENYSPYDMLHELKSMFEKQAGVESYMEQLEHLGYILSQDNSVGLILNGLTNKFVGFVRNYNIRNMGKMIGELHALLIEYEKAAKGKGQGKGNGKDKLVYIPKPKNPKPSAKEHMAKDDTCHHCKEMGHWKRNCHVYLAELIKKKKQAGIISSSGLRGERKLKQGDVCLKMTRIPFPHRTKKASDLLGLIYTDAYGPLRNVSRQGA